MDKLTGVKRETKAIVEHLIEHRVIEVHRISTWLLMNPYITKETLEKYIEEAILDFMKREDLDLVGHMDIGEE